MLKRLVVVVAVLAACGKSKDKEAPKPEAKPIKLAEARKSTPPAGTPSVADRLSNLDDLLKKKLILQDEYNAKRAQILGGI